jgi:hypothetical protein
MAILAQLITEDKVLSSLVSTTNFTLPLKRDNISMASACKPHKDSNIEALSTDDGGWTLRISREEDSFRETALAAAPPGANPSTLEPAGEDDPTLRTATQWVPTLGHPDRSYHRIDGVIHIRWTIWDPGSGYVQVKASDHSVRVLMRLPHTEWCSIGTTGD